jgi:small neutral amino acid transporter SnatA (MarC family)
VLVAVAVLVVQCALGDTVIDVFTRLQGILLASLSVQIVWAGLLSRS